MNNDTSRSDRVDSSVVVKKFGGSSLADVVCIRTVAEHVVAAHRAGDKVVVVVSAMGKSTDELVRLAHQVTETPDRREMDMLLTAGERISMALLALAIRSSGVAATSLTGSQCGIITNDVQGQARIVEVRPYRVEDALGAGHVVIVAGYQGVSYRREVTTLGRGGSDTTAVALAAALGARACEIYTDVDGVYSADPQTNLSAQRLATVTYDEMLELARAGAKVLAEEAISFAQAEGIALFVRASDGRPGETLVRKHGPQASVRISGVAIRRSAQLWVYDSSVELEAALSEVLQRLVVCPLMCVAPSAGGVGVLVVARAVADDVGKAFDRQLTAVNEQLAGAIRRQARGDLVSIVGSAVGSSPGIEESFRDVLSSVAATGCDGQGVEVLAHGMTLSALVDPACAEELARILHSRFVEES